MTKQMIRVIDGVDAGWEGGPGDIDKFWDDMGQRYRHQFINLYAKQHQLDEAVEPPGHRRAGCPAECARLEGPCRSRRRRPAP